MKRICNMESIYNVVDADAADSDAVDLNTDEAV